MNSDYGASKGCLHQWHSAFRQEMKLKRKNIKTTIIYSYLMDTPLFPDVQARLQWYPNIYIYCI